MEWISVKDILPQHEELVLAYKKNSAPIVLFFHCSENSSNYLFLNPENMRFQYKGITHWMELPEIPADLSKYEQEPVNH